LFIIKPLMASHKIRGSSTAFLLIIMN
jgi:hypothetical protein